MRIAPFLPLFLSIFALLALLAGGTPEATAQIKLINSATGGPPFATTVGSLHSIDSHVFQIGTASCARTSLTSISYLPTLAALDPLSTGSGGPAAAPGFTIQWWYKVSQPTLFGYLWGESGWSAFRCFQNGVAGTANVIIRGPLTDLATTGSPLQNATSAQGWVHFACVVDTKANATTWYVNGALNATGPANITGKGSNLACFGYDGSAGVPGHEDDFRIYNWARTAADVQADYLRRASGVGPSGSPNVPDLGYYECDLPTSLAISGAPNPGGTVDLGLLASASAGLPYQVGSSFGIGPIPIGTRSLGLSVDALLEVTVRGHLPQVFVHYAGVLDAQGRAQARIRIPALTALIGQRIHSAFVTVDSPSPYGVKEISGTETFAITK